MSNMLPGKDSETKKSFLSAIEQMLDCHSGYTKISAENAETKAELEFRYNPETDADEVKSFVSKKRR